jgi:hypothetical protein
LNSFNPDSEKSPAQTYVGQKLCADIHEIEKFRENSEPARYRSHRGHRPKIRVWDHLKAIIYRPSG